ncbi:MAG: FtsX-like permease family protein [Bacteroidota bacterium]
MFWLLKMAWRDSRKNLDRLALFTGSIVLGIAALVAINSFGDNLKGDIDNQAKSLLGADLMISSSKKPIEELIHITDSLNALGNSAREISFASMVLFPENDGTRLVNVKALEGDFPFYGTMSTVPEAAAKSFRSKQAALVDKAVMIDFGAEVGDSIKVGKQKFVIEGQLNSVPGQSDAQMGVVPSVYIPLAYLESSGLVQKGSRVLYKYYYVFDDPEIMPALDENLQPRLRKLSVRYENVEERKEDVSEAFIFMTRFLNLVSFVALLLGCIGVASAVHIYIKDKIQTVAILRCLGVKGNQALAIFLIQILGMGLMGAIVGAFVGTFVQTVLPAVIGDFIPFEVNMTISWPSIFEGIFLGVIIALLFALIPLLGIRQISPLRTLRVVDDQKRNDPLRWVVYGLIALFIYTFSYMQLNGPLEALFFSLFIGFSFLLLTTVAKVIMWLVRKYFPVKWNFLWRQSLANLYRPNNQTLILIISIGLGTALITTLFVIRGLLLSQVQVAQIGDLPNMIVFDVQTPQKDELAELTRQYELPVMQEVSIVNMKVASINGKTREEIEKDSVNRPPRWAFNRENRVTYRSELTESEAIIDGEWIGKVQDENQPIPISLEDDYADAMNVGVGDKIVFDIQGAMVETEVKSLRSITWNRIETNFFVLFPTGILENAPQFHVLVTRTDSTEQAVQYQKAVVKAFPNVSVVDLTLILTTLDDLLGKISFVITFMALFSIFTGLLVLIGSVILSKYQRIRESVLLRTLGAGRRQILVITALEYTFLGTIAAATGIFLALMASWALAYFSFETTFVPPILPIIGILIIIIIVTVLIGLSNSRSILSRPPLEVLRAEV